MPDPTPNLVDITASLRRHSPGAVPKSFETDTNGSLQCCGFCDSAPFQPMPDDIARHILGFAMVLDCNAVRDTNGWGTHVPERDWCDRIFADADHNNDQLLSLYFAWKFAKGIADA